MKTVLFCKIKIFYSYIQTKFRFIWNNSAALRLDQDRESQWASDNTEQITLV
jgi:hypothetical protein